jgi:beta-lactamase superfamily II metal-dependent hydrolase
MKALECIVFNVEHGFCAFIKSPNDYGLLIDCGSSENFSPIKWIKEHYNKGIGNIIYFKGTRVARCIITHLHIDHFSDVGAFEVFDAKPKRLEPKRLTRDKKALSILDRKIATEKNTEVKEVIEKFMRFQKQYTEPAEDEIDWGFDFFEWRQISLEAARDVSANNDDKFLNNRSYIVSIGYAGYKILFPGDIEVEGWRKAMEDSKFKGLFKNTDFFITSHHGHKTGFTSEILGHTGIPFLYIVSAKSGDENISTSYSKSDYSKGFMIKGDRVNSRMISTRERGSIKITISPGEHPEISTIDTEDNLNKNQKKQLSRRSKKIISKLGIA